MARRQSMESHTMAQLVEGLTKLAKKPRTNSFHAEALDRLSIIMELRHRLELMEAEAVVDARTNTAEHWSYTDEVPWDRIGSILGMTKQGASKKFGNGKAEARRDQMLNAGMTGR